MTPCVTLSLLSSSFLTLLGFVRVFLTEYTPEAYKRRAFMTGFNGSAGTAVIPAGDDDASPAFLWTDSRYWNEAGMLLDPACWTLQKQGHTSGSPQRPRN